jgi:hypothetical protein
MGVDEQEWRACADPYAMLMFLHGRATERKLRLFVAACCRRAWAWGQLTDPRSRLAVEAAEGYADGAITASQSQAAAVAAQAAVEELAASGTWNWDVDMSMSPKGLCMYAPAVAAETGATFDPAYAVGLTQENRPNSEDQAAQVALVRDIFADPFHPVSLAAAWRTPTVVALATAAYEDRHLPAGTLDLDRLAILADALEEAGCAGRIILDHLRSPGPHCRGCFVVDAVRSVD